MAERWSQIDVPMRPSAEDMAIFAAAISPDKPVRCLLLGLTPELARLSLPPGSIIVPTDFSEPMRSALCGLAEPLRTTAVIADWRQLPYPDSCFDLVLGDGVYTVIGGAAQQQALSRSIRRVLRPGGQLIVRHFVRPENSGTPDETIALMHAGHFATFQGFKMRYLMSMTSPITNCVEPRDCWEHWEKQHINRRELAARLGFAESAIDTIDGYRGSAEIYNFSTLEGIRGKLSEHFTEEWLVTPSYRLGESCPVMGLTPR
jgi:SAM-dependent methyltransferase